MPAHCECLYSSSYCIGMVKGATVVWYVAVLSLTKFSVLIAQKVYYTHTVSMVYQCDMRTSQKFSWNTVAVLCEAETPYLYMHVCSIKYYWGEPERAPH